MSAEIEVIIDSEPIYSIDINTVDEIFEITTSNIENIYELVVIEPSFFSSSFLDDSINSPIKTYSSEKIETIVTELENSISEKQDITQFKTINGEEITGEGNLTITAMPTSTDIQIFTSSGTWTKPKNVQHVRVLCIGGAGGGGSGRVGAAGTVRGGGGSGAGGSAMLSEFTADFLPSTVPIIVGAGADGGALVSTSDTNGNAGGYGGKTAFGYASLTYLEAGGGGGGGGGTTSGGSTGSTTTSAAAGNLLSASVTGGPGNTGTPAYAGSSGTNYNQAGAGGGGISAANAVGAGNYLYPLYTDVASISQPPPLTGNLSISSPSYTIGDGVSGLSTFLLGGLRSGGGTGGGASITSNAGKGGDGGIGSGGGGGGAALNGFSSGAGGKGGDGICIVWSW